MKVQRLIEKYKKLEGVWDAPGAETARQIFLQDLKQLDEPQKVVVPQFVAEYIEKSRLKGWDLLASMCFVLNEKNKKTTKWLYLGENKNIFALAWIYGYEVEKEKRYKVVIKETKQPLYYNASDDKLFFSMGKIASHFTRQQLEKLNFGWVFDCPATEVLEVE